MKAIVCEICGSNDLVKRDGVYVCESCGTKYSVEEAKKLVGVNVQGIASAKNILSRANYLRQQGLWQGFRILW